MSEYSDVLEEDEVWEDDTPRQVMLAVARIDPWTTMKVSFLLSVAFAIAMVVATFIVWLMLDTMHVFAEVEKFLTSIGASSFSDAMSFVRLPQVMSMAVLVGVVKIIILSALSTLGAFIYNVIASLVGGIRVTLMDE